MTKLTNQQRFAVAYTAWCKVRGIKENSLWNIGKFSVIVGFSLMKLRQFAKARREGDIELPCSERGGEIVMLLNSENPAFITKTLQVKYESGFGKWLVRLRTMALLLYAVAIIAWFKTKGETWMDEL